jgi:uncharacterized membrane protein
MQDFLIHFHSGWRWILLLFLVFALINSWTKWRGNKSFTAQDLKLNLYLMSAAHLQLIVGLVLYFMSAKVQFMSDMMKDKMMRFYAVEHLTLMLIAIILITIGYAKSKRALNDSSRFKLGFYYFFFALILILLGIPWPWQDLGGSWY